MRVDRRVGDRATTSTSRVVAASIFCKDLLAERVIKQKAWSYHISISCLWLVVDGVRLISGFRDRIAVGDKDDPRTGDEQSQISKSFTNHRPDATNRLPVSIGFVSEEGGVASFCCRRRRNYHLSIAVETAVPDGPDVSKILIAPPSAPSHSQAVAAALPCSRTSCAITAIER